MQTATRSKGKVFDPDIVFPPASQFNSPTGYPLSGALSAWVGKLQGVSELTGLIFSGGKFYRAKMVEAKVAKIL